jgi:para-nitrobenzyl esterase
MQRHLFLVACAACLIQATAVYGAKSDIERHTRFGPVVGVDDSGTTGTYAWKGVPFAKPPVGELRWKAPVDPDPWKAARVTQQFGNACVQYGRIYGPGANNRYDPTIGTTLNQAVGSEDCLYLNIWRPADRRGGRPVIVFVHGGSNVSGYTADPVYDGAALAESADAVVVTVSYRLGIFGFLNVSQLQSGVDAQEDSGNFALLDIIKALHFIRDNIANFGGNPTNVTLMGQSAGAIDVYALLTTPATVDARPQLFHRAAPLSGGISLASNLPPGRIPTLNPASLYAAQGNRLLYEQVIADGFATDLAGAAAWVASQTPAQVASYLRSKTPASLLFTLLTKLARPAWLRRAHSGRCVLPVDPIRRDRRRRLPARARAGRRARDEGKFPGLPCYLGRTLRSFGHR